MKKIAILISLILISSCTNRAAIEAKARHQAQTGSRINEAQKNTDGLFEEIK